MERNNSDSVEQVDENITAPSADDAGEDRDDAVIGADDTGMLAEQRIVVETEIAEELGPT